MFQSAPKLNETVPKNGCLPEKCLCKENQFIRICQKEYIKFPFIKLVYKGTTVGSSQVVDKDIQIPAFGEAIIEKMMVKVPLMNIFSLSGGLIKAIQNKEAVKLDVKTLTNIDLGWKKVPYTKADTITLSQVKE